MILGGRTASACGTHLTSAILINCFVQPIADYQYRPTPDASPGIFDALHQARLTLAAGGGLGYNFSAIRPRAAHVASTGNRASGPMRIIALFGANAATVQSAGGRQAAQMALLNVDHPDILEFVTAKAQSQSYDNFNFSVAVTDAFMFALAEDHTIPLVHEAPPAGVSDPTAIERDGTTLWVYDQVRARELWEQIMRQTYDHGEPGVFYVDRIQAENPLAYCETIEACNPCGEQLLPAYGPCCLASLNLTRYVREPFSTHPQFDFESLKHDAATAVHMLDTVLDVTHWPLPEQRTEAHAKHRIGLGFLGLGSPLAMTNLRYNTKSGRAMATRIARVIRDAAYTASSRLAADHGPFPYFDPDLYLRSSFAQRLPKALRAAIRAQGLRNSHLCIAPTGTISIAFADNASGGIEPIFRYRAIRNKRRADDPDRYDPYPFYDHAFRIWCQINDHDPADVPPGALPASFVCAHDVSASDHAAMVAAVQPYVDSGISKTVNIPADYPFEDIKTPYTDAYCDGIKSLATFRPNTVRASILTTEEDATPPAPKRAPERLPAYDTRALLAPQTANLLEELRWPRRPHYHAGSNARYYRIRHPKGPKITVFIGETPDGEPFEIWLTGAEVPRGLTALAITLSLDMYPADRAWFSRKLAAVSTSHHPDEQFACEMPPAGETRHAPSIAAAVAMHIQYRCDELHLFDRIDRHRSPILDALVEPQRQPTTLPTTLAYFAEIKNPHTRDDLAFTLPEAIPANDPGAPPRPYALHFSGRYPPAFDALARSLTLDMCVHDTAWIAWKLRKLTDLEEPQGDFMAPAPGAARQQTYPSTIAYIATRILHRYIELGILDADGNPLDAPPAPGPATRTSSTDPTPITEGKLCTHCGHHAVVKTGGCDQCTYCNALGDCG